MMNSLTRLIPLITGLLLALSACASETPPDDEPSMERPAPGPVLPSLFENSLANESLTADTLVLIRQKHLPEGCDAIEDVFVDVAEQPSGEPGQMAWTEIWIVSGCGITRNYGVGFAEDGDGGAFFSLSPQPVTSDLD